ncbi:MAG: 4Fe-4S binding protein [Promethearchaeota archaeon]
MTRERIFPIVIDPNLCHLCSRCLHACRNNAIKIIGQQRWVDYTKCTGCLTCYSVCPYNAITVTYINEGDTIDIRIDDEKCNAETNCSVCVDICPAKIYNREENGHVNVNRKKITDCRGCDACVEQCPTNAITIIKA